MLVWIININPIFGHAREWLGILPRQQSWRFGNSTYTLKLPLFHLKSVAKQKVYEKQDTYFAKWFMSKWSICLFFSGSLCTKLWISEILDSWFSSSAPRQNTLLVEFDFMINLPMTKSKQKFMCLINCTNIICILTTIYKNSLLLSKLLDSTNPFKNNFKILSTSNIILGKHYILKTDW